MEDNRTGREKSFIREHIVPRRNTKKIVLKILAAAGLGIVFGVAAGFVIVLSGNLTEDKTVSQREQIIIVRDDTAGESGDAQSTAAGETDTEEGSSSEEEAVRTSAAEKTQESVLTEQETMKKAYAILEQGLFELTVTRNTGTDWFDTAITDSRKQFGVAVAETSDSVFLLTDGSSLTEEASITVSFGGETAGGGLQGVDSRTGLGIVSVLKRDFSSQIQVLTLGNSFQLHSMDRVYLAGQPQNVTGAVEAGFLTNVLSAVDVIDGYEQLLYTDMPRLEGGTGVLFDEKGRILGWVSDYMSQSGSTTAVACGISPLKFLLEDLCSGNAIAYLGIICTSVTRAEAEASGISTGLYVQTVEAGSPAYESGVQVGDRLVSINGKLLTDSHSLRLRLDDLKAGETVPVEVERSSPEGESSLTLEITLGER